jgi:hypothetical protein
VLKRSILCSLQIQKHMNWKAHSVP